MAEASGVADAGAGAVVEAEVAVGVAVGGVVLGTVVVGPGVALVEAAAPLVFASLATSR